LNISRPERVRVRVKLKGAFSMKSQYGRSGGTYTEIDGINYPNIAAPEPDPRPIGIWACGMRSPLLSRMSRGR